MKSSYKILITEGPDAQTYEEVFAAEDTQVIRAGRSGSEMVRTIREQDPDVVLLELFMKEFDAVEVMEKTRKTAVRNLWSCLRQMIHFWNGKLSMPALLII